MKDFTAEIFLNKKFVTTTEWQNLFMEIAKLGQPFSNWQIIITTNNRQIRFYLKAPYALSVTSNNLGAFLFKASSLPNLPSARAKFRLFTRQYNLINTINYAATRHYGDLSYIMIDFRTLFRDKFYTKTYFYFSRAATFYIYQSPMQIPAELLSIDFSVVKNYTYKTPPKYLEMNKMLGFLRPGSDSAMLAVNAFPYVTGWRFLKLPDYDFAKHSLILGSSGSGKSKFLSTFIINLYKDQSLRQKYKVVMIDPHATMVKDIGALGKVIDFLSPETSLNLFSSDGGNINASVELLLELFKTLLADQYNPKLERVLRHSLYLLLADQALNFPNLRKLLTALEYRSQLVKKLTPNLPFSVVDFFFSDFNDLRTKSYTEAISPIIAFLDEMEMIPAFSQTNFRGNLADTISQNFLTLFSLNRTKLGTKVVRTISGLIMEQLLTFAESLKCPEQIIFIVDEVAVVENPILARLLSEARKYHLSLFLVGQFFNQFSNELQNSIFANVSNYYLFRLARLEAAILADSLGLKIPTDNTEENKIKLLSGLNNRECIARISIDEKLFPAFKANTLDFVNLAGGVDE